MKNKILRIVVISACLWQAVTMVEKANAMLRNGLTESDLLRAMNTPYPIRDAFEDDEAYAYRVGAFYGKVAEGVRGKVPFASPSEKQMYWNLYCEIWGYAKDFMTGSKTLDLLVGTRSTMITMAAWWLEAAETNQRLPNGNQLQDYGDWYPEFPAVGLPDLKLHRQRVEDNSFGEPITLDEIVAFHRSLKAKRKNH